MTPVSDRAPEISDAIIRVRDITVQFGVTRVLDGLDLDVKRGEILGQPYHYRDARTMEVLLALLDTACAARLGG